MSVLEPGSRRTWARVPDGAAVRAWTRRRTRRHRRGLWALVGDVYTALFAVAMSGALTAPHLGRLVPGQQVRLADGTLTGAGADPAWVVLAVLLAALAPALWPLRRLGPLFLRPDQAAWWLPLPADRSGLLAPVLRVEAAVALASGAACGALLGVLAGAGAWGATAWSLLVGVGTAGVVLLLVCDQLSRREPTALTAVLVLAGTAALAAAFLTPFPRSGSASSGLAVAGVVGAVLLLGAWRRARAGLDVLRDRDLLEVVARSFGAHVSLLALDTRALGRLLSPPPRLPAPGRRGGPPLLRRGRRLPLRLRPLAVVAQVDALVLWRQPRRALQLLVGLLLVLLAGVVQAGWLLPAAVVLLGTLTAVLAVAEPARQAWFDVGAQAGLPASPWALRAGHLLVPAGVMTLWAGACVLPLTAGRDLAGWGSGPALALLAGVGWGGAAVACGLRPVPDFSVGLVASPVGSLPPAVGQMLLGALAPCVVVSLPVVLLVLGGTVTPGLLGIQAVLSGAVVLWSLWVPRDGGE